VKQKFELAINLIVIAFAVFLVFAFIDYGLAPWAKPPAAANIQAGETFPSVPALRLASQEPTLVLAMRDGCHFCEDSMPFYRQLGNLKQAGSVSTNLLAVLPDAPPIAAALLKSHQVDVPFAASVPLDKLGVIGTPTLILVGANRKVIRVWVGELALSAQRDVIAALGTATTATPCIGCPARQALVQR